MSVQIIKKDGIPEWAVLPYSEYERLIETAEALKDIQLYDEARHTLDTGSEELLPQDFVDRLLESDCPIRAWREYRQLTQSQLAKLADISPAYLSQLETGKRNGGSDVLKRIAQVLQVTIDDLL